MYNLLKEDNRIIIGLIAIIYIIFCPISTLSQTIEKPIEISINPLSSTISPGQRSAVEIIFKVPNGFWLGESNLSTRMPAPTIIEMKHLEKFIFEDPMFPSPKVVGVPVHKGTTRIYKGEVHVIVPFTSDADLADGEYIITIKLTYTPGLNAGSLTSHVGEEYSTKVIVSSTKAIVTENIPAPWIGDVPKDYLVLEEIEELSEPMNTLLYRWEEDTAVPNFLHWLFIDPDNHGKHIQNVVVPFVGFTENNGATIGMGLSLLDVTREGIMTGQIQVRGFYNEYVGTTFAAEIVSCPAAYFNYWLSAQYSTDGKNRGVRLHIENLTLGKKHRFGYEIVADAFRDPRYRFYGIGSNSKEEDKTNYTHRENGGILDLFWMPVNHWRFIVGGKIRSVNVSDGNEKINDFMPWTTELIKPGGKFEMTPGIKGATVVGGRMGVMYDGRNSEFTPSSGFYGKILAEFSNISEQVVTTSEKVDNYGRFSADLRYYISTNNQELTLLLRNSVTLTTDENIPFFEQATFGGDFSNRAFDNGRFYGQHSVFASMEVRYHVMHIIMKGIPMDIEMAPFLDVGQVFNNDGFQGKFNINPGMSIRILNRPNIGIIGNAAIGQDGLIFTGGVTLPF